MAESGDPSKSSSDGSDFLPSDNVYNRFKNFSRMVFGKMSTEGQKKYWEDADQRYSELDCKFCEDNRDVLLKTSPIIRYMNDNIQKLGGNLGRNNIRCRTCKTGMLGGFDHKYGIVVCANYIKSKSMLEDVISHEMVHAYDHLRFKTNLDHESSLKEIACSEVGFSRTSTRAITDN